VLERERGRERKNMAKSRIINIIYDIIIII
jgi:hypothetical protein